MVEKFRKSWVLSICLIELVTLLTNSILAHSFTPGRLSRSFADSSKWKATLCKHLPRKTIVS